MAETRVVHCKKEPFDVYIGRGSIFGNPFTHIKDRETKAEFVVATRSEAIENYREWIKTQPTILSALESLRGKRLGCYCKPKSCHGDILIEMLNEKQYHSIF